MNINWNILFVEFSKPNWDALLRFCISLKKDQNSADDLHQTSLLKALSGFSKFVLKYSNNSHSENDIRELFTREDIKYHFKNWLYKIVKNTFLDEKNKLKKWKFTDDEENIYNLPSNQSDYDYSSIQSTSYVSLKDEQATFYKFALNDELKKKMESLNDKQRSILFLVAENYTYKEIASFLDIPLGTVMSSLSRAVQKLKT